MRLLQTVVSFPNITVSPLLSPVLEVGFLTKHIPMQRSELLYSKRYKMSSWRHCYIGEAMKQVVPPLTKVLFGNSPLRLHLMSERESEETVLSDINN